ncbi:hypothetical protein GOP47_0023192 [Adiantum capillus-veneris]|uniref:Uncharacterized protein n=1 Tax=Adiantum capillus-veneris TaxID=13818 RepID=A0A9D4U714_ADICA|nr:hypothetical protein GOP47_0023192 [Adiantum capillus-veneris]
MDGFLSTRGHKSATLLQSLGHQYNGAPQKSLFLQSLGGYLLAKKPVLLMASPLWKLLAPLSMVLLTSTLVPFAVLRAQGGLLCSIARFKATLRKPGTFSSKLWPLAALSFRNRPSNSAPFPVWSPPSCGPSTCCVAPCFLAIHPYDGFLALGPRPQKP